MLFNSFRLLFLFSLIVVFPGNASAISYTNSGLLVDVYSGNDVVTTLESLGYETDSYVKVDLPDSANSLEYSNGELTVSSSDGWYSGQWSIDYAINYYIVKASNYFAVYSLASSSTDGTWSTADIVNNGGNIPRLSHLTTFGSGSVPVPEPATLILFGSGFVGLALYSRRRRH